VRALLIYKPTWKGVRLVSNEDDKEPENSGELLQWAKQTQRNIDFIVNQQAQFATDMQSLRETQERAERRWERTEESVRTLHAIAQIHEGEITALAEAQARTEAQMAETDRRMAETDGRINALVSTVERIISERRNGGQAS
jgi:chromosome segregation ATPase